MFEITYVVVFVKIYSTKRLCTKIRDAMIIFSSATYMYRIYVKLQIALSNVLCTIRNITLGNIPLSERTNPGNEMSYQFQLI